MKRLTLLAAALAAAFPALPQTVPDAGRTLQDAAPPRLETPRPAPGVDVAPPAETAAAPGGRKVTLTGVRISGQTVFTEAELRAVLGDIAGAYDLAGLQRLAQRITRHYQAHGYPFARALLPVQKLDAGILDIRVLEGRYGQVQAQGDMAEQAQRFLAGLQTGEVIAAPALERATLLLADQPGIRVSPLLRPGQEVGAGDLLVEVARDRRIKGELGLDNHGNRYTGAYRARAQLQADSPFTLGDQFLGHLLYTDEGLWLGNLGYSLPLGANGLRASLGYSHAYYELGKDFRNLRAHGTAKAASLGLSYPILRSRDLNLKLSVSLLHKDLEDRQDATATRNTKESTAVPVTLQFDRRDSAGVTWGALSMTTGHLKLDPTLKSLDQASGTNRQGRFVKWNLDLARVQRTSLPELTLFGRLSVQGADKNLDSSESFLLGGATGVRAYPHGEGNGDEGWLAQLEARWRLGKAEPFVFYDAGKVKINARPGTIVPPVTNNDRRIAGAGVGVRFNDGPWNVDATLAWRTHGGPAQSDTQDKNPRLWITAAWKF